MDTGDVVFHHPSGEKWVVAYVRDDYLVCCGWPESSARLGDCELVQAATPEERLDLLKRMAGMPEPDSRKRHAIHRLEQILPKEA